MSQLVVLNLGKGHWQQGFSTVIAQLWQPNDPTPVQFTGGLPAAPDLELLYQRWQRLYETLYSYLGWRSRTLLPTVEPEFEIDDTDFTYVSATEFEHLCQKLQQQFNQWLNADEFRNIDRKLRTCLVPTDEVRFIITTEFNPVLRLPWCLWQFFDDYPNAELALSPPEFTRSIKTAVDNPGGKVKILAVLGDRHGIDIEQDRALLERLPHTELTFLVEPSRTELDRHLWQPGWDLFFFAGHSSSQGKGQIQVNQSENLTIDQLKYALRKAIEQGLKLAIFNSCDGLGLARTLADLHLPQVIVMREPVPDRVAQEFLKHFLMAFSSGRSLYAAVREAREKLQPLEQEFPCATWLPVICQNPAEVPSTWEAWQGPRVGVKRDRLPGRGWRTVLFSGLLVTAILTGVRWLGWLQPLELGAFDLLTRLRPAEKADPRLIIVTVTEQDIQSQGAEPRQGSLSDRSLNRLLAKLEQYNPIAIGLDLYRDFPVSANQPDLAQRLKQNDRLVAICKRPDPVTNPIGIVPPPEVPSDRLGFSDFVEDNDGVLRRHLLVMSPNPVSPCTPALAFSVQLAFRYLNAKGVVAEFTPTWALKLGSTIAPRLGNRTGGYQPMDAGGVQLLLNYRSTPQRVAQQVTLAQVLSGEINPAAFKDRVVLVGVTSPNTGDYWATPYGKSFVDRVPGVFLQAQMVSQLLSTALDGRPLLWVWHLWGEIGWIGGWAIVGGLLAWYFRHPVRWTLTIAIAIVIVSGLCFIVLIVGGWIPLVPAGLAIVLTNVQVLYLTSRSPN